MCFLPMCLPAISATRSTSWLMVTISCDPMFTGAGKIRAEQPHRSFDALVDIQKRAGLFAVAPHLYGLAVACHGNFAANRGGRLFAPSGPGPLRPEDIMVSGDIRLYPVISTIGQIQALAE
jgi:hypothetical protein